MSVIPKTRLPMRIIALPLTSAVRGPRHAEEPSPLVYYHFQMPPKADNKRGGWVDWATGKAASVWAQFGKSPENSWKFKIFTYGERLADRVDFEELALKGVDPSMGPKLSQPRSPRVEQKRDVFIPLVHPKIVGISPLAHLETILTRRTPRHRKAVIPNLPFFFCVWRSWSHYRAYKASDYLQSLLQRGAIVPHHDANLDGIYAKYAPSNTSHDKAESISGSGKTEERMREDKRVLLRRDAVPHILELYALPESAASDIYRAVEQVCARLRRGIYT